MPSINPLDYNEITSFASPGVSAGVDFNIAGFVPPRFEIDLSTPTIIPNNTSPWWPPAGDYHHNTHVHNGNQVNISAQEDFTMRVGGGDGGWDYISMITDNATIQSRLGYSGTSGTYAVNDCIKTFNKCLFCGLMINDEYEFICKGCYTKLSDNIELLDDYVRNICESCTDVVLRLNMIGILLTHHKTIDAFNVSSNDIHIDFSYSVNGKRMVLINKIPDSPADIVPREMFIID